MEMTQQFVAVGVDSNGNRISNFALNWSVENGGGTIDGTGLFTAGAAPGTYEDTVKVEATRGGVTRSATADVTVEPDRILFFSDRNEEKPDIYIMDADGSNVKRLTDTSATEGKFSFSPDGQRIVYDSGGSRSKIMVMSADGSGKLCLSGDDAKTKNHSAAWSPDGTRIVFSYHSRKEFGVEEYSDIFVVDADGGNLTQLTDTSDQGESDPAWSPDGTQIAFSSSRDIYVMDADGGNVTQLTDTSQLDEGSPVWSPDGTQIMYSVGGGIYVMNADGSNQKRLKTNASWPAWSPDGTKIAFAYKNIYVINPDGSDSCQLTSGKLIINAQPAWSPDGSKIVFAYRTEFTTYTFPPGGRVSYVSYTDWEILVINADGSHQTRLTDNKNEDTSPKWVPRRRGVEVTKESVVIPGTSS